MQTGTVQVEREEIDHLLRTYYSAVEDWIAAIREEEALAFKARKKAKLAKRDYDSALRDEFFNFR